ncbi:MAG: hypothetical protein LBG58_06180 [Planctomycetaceae bacterium]|jgi:serine/threonine protein kinase|nr:hypothetical protein [Planctomycetaceae bacterium]
MQLVKTTTTDGTLVEFQYDAANPTASGTFKDVYFAPDESYVVAFFKTTPDETELKRIEKVIGDYRNEIYLGPGGDYLRELYCWPEKIVKYDGKIGLVTPAFRQEFLFDPGPGETKRREKVVTWFGEAYNFNNRLQPYERGELLGYLQVCMKLARAVRRLYTAGMAHSDISHKNCLVNPAKGNACIIDIEGLVVNNLYPPKVIGTPGFMAPEVVTNRARPSTETDSHSLAVLIYMLLFHRHPLIGGAYHSEDDTEQKKLEMGEKALFIENPVDTSNRLTPGPYDKGKRPWVDPVELPYTVCGSELKELFDRAFIDGLHNPSQRPTANDWETALLNTIDMYLECKGKNCLKKGFIFSKNSRQCPYCGTPYKGSIAVLDFSYRNGSHTYPENHSMVCNEKWLYPWHVSRDSSPNETLIGTQKDPVGYFSFDRGSGKHFIVNTNVTEMKNVTTNSPVPIGQSVELTNGLELCLSPRNKGRTVKVRIFS